MRMRARSVVRPTGRTALVLLAFAIVPLASQLARADLIAGVYGSFGNNVLTTFDSGALNTVNQTLITGLSNPGSEFVLGIDYRVTDGLVYLLTVGHSSALPALYTLDIASGLATFRTTTSANLNGLTVGFDINPVTGLIHVSPFSGPSNQTIDPDTGQVAIGADFAGAAWPLSLAFTNSLPGAGTTTLYALDVLTFNLVTLDPTTGGINPIGPSSGFSYFPDMDISGATGIAYTMDLDRNLVSINLVTGTGTVIGAIGGTQSLLPNVGLTVVPAAAVVPEPSTLLLMSSGVVGLAALARHTRRRAG